jgi:hypothetical protein
MTMLYVPILVAMGCGVIISRNRERMINELKGIGESGSIKFPRLSINYSKLLRLHEKHFPVSGHRDASIVAKNVAIACGIFILIVAFFIAVNLIYRG